MHLRHLVRYKHCCIVLRYSLLHTHKNMCSKSYARVLFQDILYYTRTNVHIQTIITHAQICMDRWRRDLLVHICDVYDVTTNTCVSAHVYCAYLCVCSYIFCIFVWVLLYILEGCRAKNICILRVENIHEHSHKYAEWWALSQICRIYKCMHTNSQKILEHSDKYAEYTWALTHILVVTSYTSSVCSCIFRVCVCVRAWVFVYVCTIHMSTHTYTRSDTHTHTQTNKHTWALTRVRVVKSYTSSVCSAYSRCSDLCLHICVCAYVCMSTRTNIVWYTWAHTQMCTKRSLHHIEKSFSESSGWWTRPLGMSGWRPHSLVEQIQYHFRPKLWKKWNKK